MEQRIKEQLFGTARVSIRIEEKYALSEQYTPQALMEEYRESILEELREYSVLAANMFDQAEIRFEGEKGMCLELVDTIVSEGNGIISCGFWRKCSIRDSRFRQRSA